MPQMDLSNEEVAIIEQIRKDKEEAEYNVLRYPNGNCEDYPCCEHEMGDCQGLKYGSDEAIKEEVYRRMSNPDYDEYYDDYLER
jgi:hypothetical protein